MSQAGSVAKENDDGDQGKDRGVHAARWQSMGQVEVQVELAGSLVYGLCRLEMDNSSSWKP